jgi:hypothetical protein
MKAPAAARAHTRVDTTQQLRQVLRGIEVGPFMNFHWRWELIPARVGNQRGWGLQVSFVGLDRDTGAPGPFASRHEFVSVGASESSVVKTAWLLLELAVRHELMQAFRYRGTRVFDPHHTVEQLAAAAGRTLRPLEALRG